MIPRMTKFLLPAITALTILATAQPALAEGYVVGGIHFPERPDVMHRIGPYAVAPNGQTVAWLAGAGIYLPGSFIALDFAWARTGVMSSAHTSALGRRANLDFRDNFVSFGVRVRLRTGSYVNVEPVVAFVLARGEHWSQEDGGYPRLKNITTRGGAAFGADARIGSPRVGVVPGFRFYWTEKLSTTYPGGSRALTTSPSVAVQVNF